MADDLDPAAVERALAAWAHESGLLSDEVDEEHRRAIRAALAAARDGEAEPIGLTEERIANLLADLSNEPAHRHAALVREFVADAGIEVTR